MLVIQWRLESREMIPGREEYLGGLNVVLEDRVNVLMGDQVTGFTRPGEALPWKMSDNLKSRG